MLGLNLVEVLVIYCYTVERLSNSGEISYHAIALVSNKIIKLHQDKLCDAKFICFSEIYCLEILPVFCLTILS